jgi:hypothetical protein
MEICGCGLPAPLLARKDHVLRPGKGGVLVRGHRNSEEPALRIARVSRLFVL